MIYVSFLLIKTIDRYGGKNLFSLNVREQGCVHQLWYEEALIELVSKAYFVAISCGFSL